MGVQLADGRQQNGNAGIGIDGMLHRRTAQRHLRLLRTRVKRGLAEKIRGSKGKEILGMAGGGLMQAPGKSGRAMEVARTRSPFRSLTGRRTRQAKGFASAAT